MRVLLVLLCVVCSPALANDRTALEEPGTFAIMRHALGTGDVLIARMSEDGADVLGSILIEP